MSRGGTGALVAFELHDILLQVVQVVCTLFGIYSARRNSATAPLCYLLSETITPPPFRCGMTSTAPMGNIFPAPCCFFDRSVSWLVFISHGVEAKTRTYVESSEQKTPFFLYYFRLCSQHNVHSRHASSVPSSIPLGRIASWRIQRWAPLTISLQRCSPKRATARNVIGGRSG